MRRNKNEFQLYNELFEAMEESMEKVSALVREKEEAERKAREEQRKALVGRLGGMKGSSM